MTSSVEIGRDDPVSKAHDNEQPFEDQVGFYTLHSCRQDALAAPSLDPRFTFTASEGRGCFTQRFRMVPCPDLPPRWIACTVQLRKYHYSTIIICTVLGDHGVLSIAVLEYRLPVVCCPSGSYRSARRRYVLLLWLAAARGTVSSYLFSQPSCSSWREPRPAGFSESLTPHQPWPRCRREGCVGASKRNRNDLGGLQSSDFERHRDT